MNLEQYKHKIEFMAWDKKNKRFAGNVDNIYVDEEGNSLIAREGSCCNYVLDNIDVAILPYTNCKDAAGNKLYLFDVVETKDGEKLIVIFDGDYCLRNCYNTFFGSIRELSLIRLGSIYELTDIQKQFNIEV
jgi:hypothetical protein